MSRKNTRTFDAPSTSAASSTSREMPRKNWRRKNTANGVISMLGSAIPSRVSTSPSCLMSTKFGSSVKIAGIISPARKNAKTFSRCRHCSRANAYAAIAEKNTWPAVTSVETTTELNR